MKLRKFFGSTSRVVLQQVRTELGPDAVILMNRPTAQGIEITAMAGKEMDTMFGAEPAPSHPARRHPRQWKRWRVCSRKSPNQRRRWRRRRSRTHPRKRLARIR